MSDIVPTQSLDDYLCVPFNQRIYQDLEMLGLDPLKFFRFFYSLVALIDENKPSEVIQELDRRQVNGGARLFVLFFLREKDSQSLALALGFHPEEPPNPAMFLIDKEYDRVAASYPPDLFIPEDAPLGDLFRRVVGINEMSNKGLEDMLATMMKKQAHEREIEARARQDEREQMKKSQTEMVLEVLKTVRFPRQNPEFTTNRQVIAICYLLQAVGAEANSSEQSRFIEFLTNKTNKEIYKRVLAIDSTIYNLDGKDAIYVRDWFDKLGLNKLVKKIDEILGKPHKQLE